MSETLNILTSADTYLDMCVEQLNNAQDAAMDEDDLQTWQAIGEALEALNNINLSGIVIKLELDANS